MKVACELEVTLPPGFKPVAYRCPKVGEVYLSFDCISMGLVAAKAKHEFRYAAYLILERVGVRQRR